MKFAENRGCRIAYDIAGERGPVVVLQHGLLSNRLTWEATGYVTALDDAYRVISVDSLGHGDSDKPTDATLYDRRSRAGDIVAVLDAEGVNTAHYVGYSMGGWIGSGMAVHFPERLASLTIGGWDPVGGAGESRPMAFAEFLGMAQKAAPQLTAWVTDDAKPGLAACWQSLSEVANAEAALRKLEVPLLLWCGSDDACHEPCRALAAELGAQFHSVPGDHVAARMVHVAESSGGVRRFLDSVTV